MKKNDQKAQKMGKNKENHQKIFLLKKKKEQGPPLYHK